MKRTAYWLILAALIVSAFKADCSVRARTSGLDFDGDCRFIDVITSGDDDDDDDDF